MSFARRERRRTRLSITHSAMPPHSTTIMPVLIAVVISGRISGSTSATSMNTSAIGKKYSAMLRRESTTSRT